MAVQVFRVAVHINITTTINGAVEIHLGVYSGITRAMYADERVGRYQATSVDVARTIQGYFQLFGLNK